MIAALALAVIVGTVAPTEVLHYKAPATLVTSSGKSYPLPPGYAVPEARWSSLDLELRRLQEAETRLSAENQSLRRSATSGPSGFWKVAGAVFVVGLAAGLGIGAAL